MSERFEIFLFLDVEMPTVFSKKNWNFVKKQLEKKPDIYIGESIVMPSITSSIKSMRENTASKIIKAINDTEYEVRCYSKYGDS